MLSQFKATLLVTILFSPKLLAEQFIIWNVGQGSSSTYINSKQCLHFDFGGEKMSWRSFYKLCGKRENQFYLSHSHWDHISHLRQLQKTSINFCVHFPIDKMPKLLQTLRLKNCTTPKLAQVLFAQPASESNAASIVYKYKNILIPGDSGQKQEKLWSQHPAVSSSKILLLGHHGSKSSSSELLLKTLRVLTYAIASARHKKYGHPSDELVWRLKLHKMILLKTEDWGNIIFEL